MWRAWCSRLLRAAQALALLGCGAATTAQAADFREPLEQPFLVWPNIPVVRASDLSDYSQDRQIFSDLHTGKAEPEKMLAALQGVDSLQAHHERTALAQLGRSLNVQFIGELDKQTRRLNTRQPKLRFEFAGITPEDLQRASALDARSLDALKARANQVTLVAYITYTRLEGPLVQATITLVKPRNGESQSFSATAPAPLLGETLAREVFDYFHGTRFLQHHNALPGREWLTSAPGHADQLVSRDMAQRYCQSQQAALPTANELEAAEAAGFYGGGVTLQPYSLYHIQSGLYDATGLQEGADRTRPNHLASVRNGYYYCIRSRPAPATARGKK